jgi:saccharopine dehydrogenase-like NADP-dependent oxidoreductase
MNSKTLLILGGYGQTGRRLAHLLLAKTDVCLALGGRNLVRAESLAAQLNVDFKGNRARGTRVDAAQPACLARAFEGVDFVIVASSTTEHTRQVAFAALAAGIDYLDVQFSTEKLRVLKSLRSQIEKAKRCFITEAGFHPGLPAALVRYVSQCFDQLHVAEVASVIKIDWRTVSLSPSTAEEFVKGIMEYESLFYKGGAWTKARWAGMTDYRTFDFGGVFGEQYAVPMMLEEMRAIPDLFPSIREAGFYIGGFNWFVDWLVLPLAMLALRISPDGAVKPVSRLMDWGLKAFSRPPFGVILKVEAKGEKKGQDTEVSIWLSHQDGYMFTAIPVVACMLQYLEGRIRKPGLWMMGHLVDPDRLVLDMQRMGINMCGPNSKGGSNHVS